MIKKSSGRGGEKGGFLVGGVINVENFGVRIAQPKTLYRIG